METTTLGNTGLQVSRLGAGLYESGLLADPCAAGRVLNAALDGGINFLDTAIVGTGNPEHMQANIRRVEEDLPLPPAVIAELHRRFEEPRRAQQG